MPWRITSTLLINFPLNFNKINKFYLFLPVKCVETHLFNAIRASEEKPFFETREIYSTKPGA
jgi:hypothetical protein